ncbi:argonaute-like protein [Mycena olivaceomarginata]|nr:argonaute-like protein [Mycena olivaceomarginata]
MPPRGPARGRTQAPHDPLNPATGRGTPTRGRSVARGGRGDGVRTAEGSQAGGAQDTRGSDDPQPVRGRGMRRGLSHGRGEGSTSPAGTGSVRGGSQRGAFRARGEPSTRSRSLGSWPLRRGHRAEEEGEVEPIAIGDLPAYRQPEAGITTIGARRHEYGQAGKARRIQVNTFPTAVVGRSVYQYDVSIFPPESFPRNRPLNKALNMRLVRELQYVVRPDLFVPPAVYDGQKKLYCLKDLDLAKTGNAFDVRLDTKTFTIRLKRVDNTIIDTSVLLNFIQGKRSSHGYVVNALQTLSVALRMKPLSDTALSVAKERRIFYTPFSANELRAANVETAELGFGVVLWRGLFQSLRPGIDRLFVNVDVSTGAMYNPTSLIQLACDYLAENSRQKKNVSELANLSDHDHERLLRFILGLRVEWNCIGTDQTRARSIKGLSSKSADREVFTRRDGRQTTVADYFFEKEQKSLKYPGLPCVQVGNVEDGRGALLPLELVRVVPGQPLRTALPDALNFNRRKLSVRPPGERFQSIEKGLQVLGYGQSDYVRQFGVTVATSMLSTVARVLDPPMLKYRSISDPRENLIEQPRNGAWNMTGKHFYKPAKIETWTFVSYVPVNQFPHTTATQMIQRLVGGCRDAGIELVSGEPAVKEYILPDDVLEQLDGVARRCIAKTGCSPSLLVVVLPNRGSGTTYTRIKHWGDIKTGIPTQCIKLLNALNEKLELWTNIAHKINMKLGGINVVVDQPGLTVPGGIPLLGDIKNATVIMGGLRNPSYSAVVSSVDAHASKYVEQSHLQKEKRGNEMIEDLQHMTGLLLSAHMRYRRENEVEPQYEVPKRLIFYRDGVSEDQFQTVLEKELPAIKNGCRSLNINPKITLIIVTKRHHIRFFDKKDNCRSGTVVDRDIVHPTEFDFYLQSHGQRGPRAGRAALYSVLYDENHLTPDQVQALSFALCHAYSCSTSAVSIPAPVYCSLCYLKCR